MKSFFVTGTDTEVGKTYVTAGLVRSLCKMGIDVGIMKPFAAGMPQNDGYKSQDVKNLSQAARVNEPEDLLNPYFFSIPASPYTASQKLGIKINIDSVLQKFKQLSSNHDLLLVEGIGGIMTPILKNYFVINLIKDMNLETIIVTSNKIGTINHTIMTCNMCSSYGISLRGIIINNFVQDGYPPKELKNDLENLTMRNVLGILPPIPKFDMDGLAENVKKEIDLNTLLA